MIYTFLRKEWILVVIVVIGAITSIIGLCLRAKYDWETTVTISYFAFVIAFTALIATLLLTRESLNMTKQSLDLTRFDMETRVRPFVSCSGIESITLVGEHSTIPSITLPLQNTGTVPAVELRIDVKLRESGKRNNLDNKRFIIPAMAPNSVEDLLFPVPYENKIQGL